MKKKYVKIIGIILVNIITLIRLFGSLYLPYLYFYKDPSDFAITTICLFMTDCIDGFLARFLHVSTFFGSMMDAISDKLLNFISFLLLGFTYKSMLLPLIIEISILSISYATYRYGGNVKSSKIGKLKTIILDIFVILSFILLSLKKFNINGIFYHFLISKTSLLINIFSIIITISCLIALFDYLKKYKRTREDKNLSFIKYDKKKRKSFKRIIKDLFDTKYYIKHKDESIAKQFYL